MKNNLLEVGIRFNTSEEVTFGIMPPILFGSFKKDTEYIIERLDTNEVQIQSINYKGGCTEMIIISYEELEKVKEYLQVI